MKHFARTLIIAFTIVAICSQVNSQTITNQFYNVSPGNGNGLRFWSSNNYKIHMGNSSNYQYGPVSDYSIKMTMNNDAQRGWTWGVLNARPIAALDTRGTFQLAKDLRVLGNTGIGTSYPNSRLHVRSSAGQHGLRVQINGASKLTVASNGGTTIGTYENNPPTNGLYVHGDLKANNVEIHGKPTFHTNGLKDFNLKYTKNSYQSARLQIGIAEDTHNFFPNNGEGDIVLRKRGIGRRLIICHATQFNALPSDATGIGAANDEDLLWVHNNGNVRIGKYSENAPEYKLDVAGTIRATEIKVEAQTADFVFEDDYSLRDLDQVESFINENKHLPDIPSAQEMEASGVNLAEMNKLLLMKVEELTLYAIEKEKKVEELQEKGAKQKAIVEQLKKDSQKTTARLEKIEALLEMKQ
ncbi:MAG: cell division protein ZapB [Bacteroidota bacterium]